MFSELPKEIQVKVEKYLAADNFKAAKAVHDSWLDQSKKCAVSVHHRQMAIAEPIAS